MSLINNALKKAQHQRSGETASVPMPGGSGRQPNRRGRAMPAQTLLLIVVGALALITASVVATVFLLGNDEPAPHPSVASASVASSQPVPDSSPATTIIAPTAQPSESKPTIDVPRPVIEKPIAALPPEPASTQIAPQLPEPIPEPIVNLGERVYQFIDQLQVMGIRSSGADSKVLMNDRVYRVNDIVNRELGLRLVTVAPDSLTFVDSSGASYTKNF